MKLRACAAHLRPVRAMSTQREANDAERAREAGRRLVRYPRMRRGTTALLGMAGLLAALSGCGEQSTLTRASAASNASAASSAPAGPLDARLAEVRAELAAHPTWRQRQITMQDGLLVLPYGPDDPDDYWAWIVQLGNRYDGGIRPVYVQDTPGAPAPAELRAIKDDMALELRGVDMDFASVLTVELRHGRVELEYQPTTNAAFLALVARWNDTYGDRFHAEATQDYPQPRLESHTPVTRKPRSQQGGA